MKFEEAYGRAQEAVRPGEGLIRRTATAAAANRRPRLRWKRPVAVAAALALTLSVATPVLAANVKPVYELLYLLSPAAAQLFQRVQQSDTDNGIRLEVVGVSVEGNTAQAYITLRDLEGNRVDATTDLYDSWSLRVPFDSTGHCERLGYDAATKTATFLVTTQTMHGEAIEGGKQSFSLNCFLSGKKSLENARVDLSLADYAAKHATIDTYESSGGGGSAYEQYKDCAMLLPGEPLTTPMAESPITAMGYADGLLRVQVQLLDHLKTDSHCFLTLKTDAGKVVQPLANVYFTDYAAENRVTYVDFLFDVAPEALGEYALYGDFYASGQYTEGNWQLTYPLENR